MDEQVIVKADSGWWSREGPWRGLIDPGRKKEFRRATLLQETDYAVVTHVRSGTRRVVEGPTLLFPDAYETVESVAKKVVLEAKEYCRIRNIRNGTVKTLPGPTIYVPGAYEDIEHVSQKPVLEPLQYALVKENQTGVVRTEEGPQLFFPGPFDVVLGVFEKLVLQRHQYARLIDERTGTERVMVGPTTVVPEANERVPKGVQDGVFVDTDTAVLTLTRTTAQQRLVQEEGVFIPGAYEEVMEERSLIHVEPHEAMVVRDSNGAFTVFSGAPDGTAFFLPPYSTIWEMQWSTYNGRDEPGSKRSVREIDLRVQMLFFAYEVRTSDNVKLLLEGSIFWQVKDVERLINTTQDPEGDVWHHSRSALMQAVSQSELNTFMSSFNTIVKEAFDLQAADGFYTNRGVEVQSMEVTKYTPVDPETAAVLQEIIRETTNRINRLQVQESDNEVAAAKLAADIALEAERAKLIEAAAANERLLAENQGEAGGVQLAREAATFINGLGGAVENLDERIDLYRMHKAMEAQQADVASIANGKGTLFMTAEDISLKVGQSQAAR
eukprot:CAMPEP_0178425996 /NCGR_PEP_ID=MMETSP0689_2-20121128/29009_1 /TAXON_ID=160604 /ORGANISM="Amphidinium massartii, Strain CS-259" /LENGTH=552 /DNA_ID=CAMNT_0020047673 /DNA_START=195 /DNA_END=1853 /DNA_ORIENTATION=+